MLRAIFLIGFAILLCGRALGEPTRDEVMSGAARCEGIADNRTWLDCFYGSAQPMRALLGLPPAPPGQIKLVPPPGAAYVRAPAPAAEKHGGFFADLLGSTKPVVKDMPMASYKFARDGTFTVTLQNGEVYQQEESDLVHAKWNKPPSAYLVTIVGSTDKFVMRVKGDPGTVFRVHRQ